MQEELQENDLKLHVLNVAAHVMFRFSPAMIVLFTAVITLQTKDKFYPLFAKTFDRYLHPPFGVFFMKNALPFQ